MIRFQKMKNTYTACGKNGKFWAPAAVYQWLKLWDILKHKYYLMWQKCYLIYNLLIILLHIMACRLAHNIHLSNIHLMHDKSKLSICFIMVFSLRSYISKSIYNIKGGQWRKALFCSHLGDLFFIFARFTQNENFDIIY